MPPGASLLPLALGFAVVALMMLGINVRVQR